MLDAVMILLRAGVCMRTPIGRGWLPPACDHHSMQRHAAPSQIVQSLLQARGGGDSSPRSLHGMQAALSPECRNFLLEAAQQIICWRLPAGMSKACMLVNCSANSAGSCLLIAACTDMHAVLSYQPRWLLLPPSTMMGELTHTHTHTMCQQVLKRGSM